MDCGICVANFDQEISKPLSLNCGHTVCETCFKKWKQTHELCPIEICLVVVRQNGWSLRHVHDQTYEIYLAAVDSSGRRALDFLKFFGSRAYHL